MTERQQTPWQQWLRSSIDALDERKLLRRLNPLPLEEGDASGLVLFSSNDYLGLSRHPVLRSHVAEAAERWGMGERGSPLICGHSTLHKELEDALAALKHTTSALLFSSGFSANLSVFSALGDKGVAIFSDELNHASIIDGCRLAKRKGASLHVYRHGDLDHLDQLLANTPAERRIIATDSLFSMDGDLADLPALVERKKRYNALLAIDDAHGTLVFGRNGGGVAEAQGVSEEVDLHIGTLSKAFGLLGGFVACSDLMKQWLLNRGRSFVFSTALPLPLVSGALKAIELAQDEELGLQKRLFAKVKHVTQALGQESQSQIIPVILGAEERALAASQSLAEAGFHVTAIRPPTVPPGTSRLRIALSAEHKDEEIERFLKALNVVCG